MDSPIRPASARTPAGATAPALPVRVAVVGLIGIALGSVLFLRLWGLTVLQGSKYEQEAKANQIRRIAVEAPRGSILDRQGRPIVTNRPARQLVLDLQDVPVTSRPQLYSDLADVLDKDEADIRAAVKAAGADSLTPIVLEEDVIEDDVIFYFEEHKSQFPGVRVRDRYERKYPAGSIAAHMVGQVGEVSADQLKGDFQNLKAGDRVGQSGLERTYDEYLRGVDGFGAVEVDAAGVRRGIGRGVPPTPGSNVRLSIDLKLQRATEKALREGISLAHVTGGPGADAAAAVAIDPRNGEVLALASYPDYDPSIFVEPGHDAEIRRLLVDRRTPLSNRAIAGLYPPASTYKVITGLAALSEGFITPDTQISCPSYLEIYGTRFNNWFKESLGAMDLAHALEQSCDTYFYKVALDFYHAPGSRLQDWSKRFGLGRPTGVDLPGEERGLIPTPEWRRDTFKGQEAVWGPGHNVNLSIGQGDLLVTPLQMTMVYGAIANGGTLHQPRLATAVEDAGGNAILTIDKGSSRKLPISEDWLREVRNGLYLAANGGNGTSTPVFQSFEVPVSGKTGTGEKPPYGDMAWYCGYAPAQAPVIAACSIVEKGGHGGSAAAPIVLRMFQSYLDAEGGSVRQSGRSD